MRDISEDDREFVTDVALDADRRVIRAFVPAMAEGGSIVDSPPLAARLAMANPPPTAPPRAASRPSPARPRRNGRARYQGQRDRPGFVITPQNAETYAEGTVNRERIDERTPLGRVADREEIVGAAISLASDAASFVTGEVVTVDGGFADSAF